MAISTHFQDEIDEVDPTKILVFVVNTSTYDLFEFSYSGLTITGGSDLACEYGASALMHDMGFAWWAPETDANEGHFTVRPASINTGLAQSKTSYWMQSASIFLTYGHSWDDIYGNTIGDASRAQLVDAENKWATLNSVLTNAWPAGHRWEGIINNNQDYFSPRQHLLEGASLGSDSVKLNISAASPAEYDELTELFASEMLKSGLNVFNRTNADPTDGDQNPSDEVYPFLLEVVTKIRSGTSAIASHPPRAGVATAQIGCYAYAGHRDEPTLAYTPGVYTQIALGFTPKDRWLPLIQGHGAKADAVFLREYYAVNDPTPWSSRTRATYFDDYDDYYAAGTLGFAAEASAYYLNNILMFRCAIRKYKTGDVSFAEELDAMMAAVFDDDPAVRELYEYWASPEFYNEYTLRRSFEIVGEMADSWYKTYFKRVLVILAKYEYLPAQDTTLGGTMSPNPFATTSGSNLITVTHANHGHVTGDMVLFRDAAAVGGIVPTGPYAITVLSSGSYRVTHGSAATSTATGGTGSTTLRYLWEENPNDEFRPAFSSIMANVVWLRRYAIFHSYGFMRQEANGAVNVHYPTLRYNWSPRPAWFTTPVAPTDAEFDDYYETLLARTPHDTYLDSDDLALVTGITPAITATTPATRFATYNTAKLKFIGPGSVTLHIINSDGDPVSDSTTSYGSGIHDILVGNIATISHNGGHLFLDTFSEVRKDPDDTGQNHWLYIPAREAGQVVMRAGGRWRFVDANGEFNLFPESNVSYQDPANLGPGQVAINNTNTRGTFFNMNCNRYVSMHPNRMLMPVALAEEEFGAYARVNGP